MDIKAKIRDASDKPLEPVKCESWANGEFDGTVYVRTMTGGERDEFEHLVSKGSRKRDNRGLKLKLVILTACNETGDILFKDDDAEWLADKSALELDRLATAALRINGFSDSDVKELEKN